jgi:hypothetical protein
MNRERGIKDTFFSGRNKNLLENLVEKNIISKVGEITINDKARIQKAVNHYTQEVYRIQGNKPVAFLNKEVIAASETDVIQKKQKDVKLANRSQSQQQQQQKQQQQQQNFQARIIPSLESEIDWKKQQQRPDRQQPQLDDEYLYLEPSKRFEELQKVRNEGKPVQTHIPDFTLPLDDTGPSSAELFNLARSQRDIEFVNKIPTQTLSPRIDQSLQFHNNLKDAFSSHEQQQGTPLSSLFTQTNDIISQVNSINAHTDLDRETAFTSLTNKEKGIGNSNPTIAQPNIINPTKRVLQQDIIIKENDELKYKEVESNLFLSSADRNWLINTQENRYNFSVHFDPGQKNYSGFGPSPAAQKHFKNIVRIEFVKAIIPAESIDILLYKDSSASTLTNIQTTALSYPQILLRIDELEGNNFGTDEQLDNAFSILQYDANWISDNGTGSKGYLAMIPKFLKCHRIYNPTPLSTLQKLTCRLERPNGSLLDTTYDTYDLSGIYGSNSGVVATSKYFTSGGMVSEFIFLQTKKYFPHFSMQRGDRIQLKGFAQNPVSPSSDDILSLNNLEEYINRIEGHLVCDIAYIDNVGNLIDGWNSVGYSNIIIIRSKQVDPTTGSENADVFGPTQLSSDYALSQEIIAGRLINLSHQIQLVFRIITRELDSNTYVRPDNLN